MNKTTKTKILLVILFILAVTLVFAISVNAEEYSVTYRGLWRDEKATVITDENGQITVKQTGYSNDDVNKQFFGWYTIEGDFFAPGEVVTLTKDTDLYEAYGYLGTQESIKYLGVTQGRDQWDQSFVQLQEDIVLDSHIAPPWGGRVIIDLNGYTITSSATNAFQEQRAGVIIVGEGSVIHTGTGHFFTALSHIAYGDGEQRLIIGKDVNVSTNGTLLNYTNVTCSVIPVEIYGNVTCSRLVYLNELSHTFNVKIDAKELTVTGDTFIKVDKFNGEGLINIDILGGNILLSQNANTLDYWNNSNYTDFKDYFDISISGGTFNNGNDAINTYLADGYKLQIIDINSQLYGTVIKESECIHNYEAINEKDATCINLASKTYVCKECNDAYEISYGDYGDHNYQLTSSVEPTLTKVGESVYTCTVCNKTKTETTFFDILDTKINVKVNSITGEKFVLAKVKEVFVLETVGENQYKLTAVKDFKEFAKNDILSVEIPLGIVDINFTEDNSTLQKLIINEGAIVTVNSFSKCTALTHIEIGASKVSFVKGCSNNAIASIKSETEGANVTFAKEVFDGKGSIIELKLSTKSKYIFGANSFRKTNITEFIAPDYTEVVFLNEAAFYNCNSLKYIYIGRGIKYLEGKPFDYCQYVEKVVLMEVEKIMMEWTFCVQNMAEKPVEYYIHSNSISLPNNTFGQSKGIVIYTNAPITNAGAFSACTGKTYDDIEYPPYTIYYGIPHKLIETYEDSNCTENGINGYKPDCPCGEIIDGTVIAKMYYEALTNSEMFEEIEYKSEIIPPKGHREGEVLFVDYLNGYLKTGLKDCICRVCNLEYTETTPTAVPLFEFLGYSMPEDGRNQITVGFIINYKAIEQYETLAQTEIEYGMVLAVADQLNGKTPLESENTQKIAIQRNLSSISLKVSGFTEKLLDLELVMAIYVTENDKTVYLQDVQSSMPNGITLNQTKNS